jgi:intracellular sulfur oxidation DsrE/DsrF family protein
LVLLAPPDAPGADAMLALAGDAPSVSLLLSGSGLAWLSDPRTARLAARAGSEVVVCSRSARERGLPAADLPPWVRPSSLVAWLRGHGRGERLWGLLP